jgi:malonate decarboxylase epsilon subunit
MKTAFLFPGQGAQIAGFLHRLPRHPAVAATLAEAEHVLGRDLDALDSARSLTSTVPVQIGTLIAGVAVWRSLGAEGARPDASAGLSVGAFAAAVACGALAFPDALRLVELRAVAMERAYPGGYGMLGIVGMAEPQGRRLIEGIATADTPLFLASVNAPAELVLAGSDVALALATSAAERAGARARRLAMAVPSHCELMKGASEKLRGAMEHVRITRPSIPYVSNHRARAIDDAKGVAEDLIVGVAQTVRWYDATTLLYELGCRLFIEPPPGRTLTKLIEGAYPDARALAVEDARLDSVVQAILCLKG